MAVLKRMQWPSNDAQNLFANWIAGDHVDPDKAAEKWVKANTAVVNLWIGKFGFASFPRRGGGLRPPPLHSTFSTTYHVRSATRSSDSPTVE